MNTIVFYLGAVALCVLGSLCLKKSSPYTREGGAKFERRTKRRTLGFILLAVAGLSLVLGIIAQLSARP